jgi:hypothetical protein
MHRLIDLTPPPADLGSAAAAKKHHHHHHHHPGKDNSKDHHAKDGGTLENGSKGDKEGGEDTKDKDGGEQNSDKEDDADSVSTITKDGDAQGKAAGAANKNKANNKNKKKKKAIDPSIDMTCRGLVAWWPFEEGWKGGGKGGDRAADVTEHRFKTLITRQNKQQPVESFGGMLLYQPLQDVLHATAPLLDDHNFVFNPNASRQGTAQARGGTGHYYRPMSAPSAAASSPRSAADGSEIDDRLLDPITLQARRDERKVKELVAMAMRSSHRAGYAWVDTECLPCPTENMRFTKNRSAKAGAGEMEFVATVPVPSYRLKNVCPYELRRFRLAQAGRLLQKAVPCPMGKCVIVFLVAPIG